MAYSDIHSQSFTGYTRSSREMPGECYQEIRRNKLNDAAARENLVGMIRNIMHDQDRPRKKLPKQMRLKPRPKPETSLLKLVSPVITEPMSEPFEKPSDAAPKRRGYTHRATAFTGAMIWRGLKPALLRLAAYRPTRKHIGIAVLAAVILLKPWLIPITLMLLVLTAAVVWLSLGPDRVSEIIHGRWQRMHTRNPEKAEKIRSRYQAGVKKINNVIAWLPESWADRLYVTDYTAEAEQQANFDERPDPFSRLASNEPQEPTKS